MSTDTLPLLVICFGVSGCGKSTAAEFIADKFNFEFVEADDFHPQVNVDHMAAGKPLTDAMREPWIQALCDHLKKEAERGKHCVMANSCLRAAHRQRFRELGFNMLFIHLNGPKEVIFERMNARENHFMPASLLDSQYDALESPEGEQDVVGIDISQTIPEICSAIDQLMDQKLNG